MKQINQLLDMVDGTKRSEVETLLSCILDEHEARQQQVHRELQEARQAAVNMMEDAMCANEKLEVTQFALDHAADPVFWISKESVFTYVNEAACRSLGYSKEELLRLSVVDIDPNFEPESWARQWDHVLQTGAVQIETAHRKKDGTVFPVEVHSAAFTFHGETRHVAFAHDITNRKCFEEALRESEEQFSTLLANLPGMAYRCENDANWTMLFLSDGCETVTGYTATELTGDEAIPYEQLIHPDDRRFVREQVEAALQADERFEVEYRIIARDGSKKWVWDRGEGRCGDGESLRLEGFITDITARKTAELRFQEQLKELNRWYKAMLGRESRVLELKREVNALLEQSGQELRYEVSKEKSEAGS